MSQESSEWLNNMTLIGFTDKRGNAWHYRQSLQGTESNHYAGAIPFADVIRRLFNWEPVEGTLQSTYVTPDGVTTVSDPTRKTIIHPNTGDILGIFKLGYQIHGYAQWLLKNVSNIVGDTLQIGSAGLLRKGAVGWVQVELPETVTTPEGVAFRPFVTAATSLDGTLASTYQTGNQLVVCDNTLAGSLADTSHMVKVRHSKNSLGRIDDVRSVLGIIERQADTFSADIKRLCETTVTDKQWNAFLVETLGEAPGADATKNAHTIYERKHDEYSRLWNKDAMSADWHGTAWGVIQVANTYAHHSANVRGASRVERNMMSAVRGEFQDADAATLATLERVLATV